MHVKTRGGWSIEAERLAPNLFLEARGRQNIYIHSFYRAYDEYMYCVIEKHLICDLFTLKML